ncbi:DNA repair protein XRCC1 [Helicoverpa zea]|uniref:DNA repair protein XRCC1 n=1 Tax=Helicoverpa zea TaxID=7113 RepID=UPI001F55FFA7|nr:DNA repair protein XRCC1 [Helicoverpa zea]
MPRVKIDYVVSFSSEDPEHPASNLLLREVSKKKWLCAKGQTTCSVVLQMPRAVQISAVHVGAYHAALVEVLVGRSETPSEPFQVLVPSSVFVSREESRGAAPVPRVRSFRDQLGPARLQRWDRLRLVCSQPYAKHCQFGLSFVHVDESEAAAGSAVPPRVLALDTYSSSDDDDFRPGELFAQHCARAQLPANDTGAQIRQATSQALKNISDSSTKLMKAHISKPAVKRSGGPGAEGGTARDRDSLLYDLADRQPPARSKHFDASAPAPSHREDRPSPARSLRDSMAARSAGDNRSLPARKKLSDPDETIETSTGALDSKWTTKTNCDKNDSQAKKRRRSDSQEQTGDSEPPPHELLRGAVLVLSGYANPARAHVRRAALALGARLRPDWGPGCTHLICAFPNTPKLRAVRAAGGAVPVATADWLHECVRRRRLLPWTWYATEPQHRTAPTAEDLLDDPPATCSEHDSAEDTDDEIEKVLQDQKTRRLTESKPDKSTEARADSDGAESESYDASTDEEAAAPGGAAGGALPDMFAARRFLVCAAPAPQRRLARYVRAHGGLLLAARDVAAGRAADYVVRGAGAGAVPAGAGGARVSARWLARCVSARALLPADDRAGT